jgi:hypothetical protein
MTAVLARVLIALKNIVPREFHFLFRQPIKHHQQNHARHPNAKRNRLDRFGMGLTQGKIVPFGKIVSPEGTVVGAENRLGVTLKEKRQRTTRRADIDRLPEAIQDEHMLVQH